MKNYLFPQNYITSEEAISHKTLYYQQALSIAHYLVSFYANNYLPIVSSAFKWGVRQL